MYLSAVTLRYVAGICSKESVTLKLDGDKGFVTKNFSPAAQIFGQSPLFIIFTPYFQFRALPRKCLRMAYRILS